MEEHINFNTRQITDLARKMEMALPGIFPDDDSPLAHHCGGNGSGIERHTFHEEIEQGTHIPHLLEHVILFLMSRCTNHCSGYCGQRSVDIEQGITTHYYIVLDYISKLEAIVAVDLAMQLVSSWIAGKTVVIDPEVVLAGVKERLELMVVKPKEIVTESEILAG